MDSKILFLILLFAGVLGGAAWIMGDLQNQSTQTFFGTAETDSRVVNLEFPVVVQEVRVQPGDRINQGDTLAVMYHIEFDRASLEYTSEINKIAAELEAENRSLDREQEELLAKYASQISDYQAEIKVLKAESDVQEKLKTVLTSSEKEAEGEKNIPNVRKSQIAALEENIRQVVNHTQEEIKRFEQQRRANQAVHDAKVSFFQRSIELVDSERHKMVLLAPMNGYIEQVFVKKNETVDKFRDLFKINALQPIRVLCFLHETEAEVMVQPGDTVVMSSTARPEVTCRGIVSLSTPKLVELPTRLRKFAEIRTWGREMYIHLPDTNRFYIGEKIQVVVPTATTSKLNQGK